MAKKVLKITALIIIILIAAVIILIRLIPSQNLPTVLKNNQLFSKTICLYPVKVQGSSMEPLIKENSRVNFTKCFDQDDLKVNDIVLYQQKDLKTVATVREVIKSQDNILVRVSQEARENEVKEIDFDQIIAVYKI